MASGDKFEGWLGHGPDAVEGKMVWGEFEPKKWEEDDVDIEVSHCGICGSDLHTLKSGWGETPYREFVFSRLITLPPPDLSFSPRPISFYTHAMTSTQAHSSSL